MALGSEDRDAPIPSLQAQQFIGWVEHGVFDALLKNYLERAVVVISRDEEGEDVIEAWSVSVKWLSDAEGRPYPVMEWGHGQNEHADPGHRDDRRTNKVACASPEYTLEKVTEISEEMLRELMSTLQYMPQLPTAHWISMRLLYRDDFTPPDYEPAGFSKASRPELIFKSKPIQ